MRLLSKGVGKRLSRVFALAEVIEAIESLTGCTIQRAYVGQGLSRPRNENRWPPQSLLSQGSRGSRYICLASEARFIFRDFQICSVKFPPLCITEAKRWARDDVFIKFEIIWN